MSKTLLTKDEIQSFVDEITKNPRLPAGTKSVLLVYTPPSAETHKLYDLWNGTSQECKRFCWFEPIGRKTRKGNPCLLWLRNVSKEDAQDIWNRVCFNWERGHRKKFTPEFMHKILEQFDDARTIESPLKEEPFIDNVDVDVWKCKEDERVALVYFKVSLLSGASDLILSEWRDYANQKREETTESYCVVQ